MLKRYLGNQAGSITPAVVACLALVILLCLFMADLGLYLAARHQAQNAADAAALAAVQESFPLFATGEDPVSAASRFAGANDASVEQFDVSKGGGRVTVAAAVKPHSLLLGRLGIGPEKVSATAAAEVDIEALLASREIWYTVDPANLTGLLAALSSTGAKDGGLASTMVALLALEHLGKPYVWGATGPDCFDCSGLVCYVYAQVGVYLPRVTFSQVHAGGAVPVGELMPGDLVFFRGNAHVGIYLGGGWYIHAPHTGDVVKVSPLGARSDISACRRII